MEGAPFARLVKIKGERFSPMEWSVLAAIWHKPVLQRDLVREMQDQGWNMDETGLGELGAVLRNLEARGIIEGVEVEDGQAE